VSELELDAHAIPPDAAVACTNCGDPRVATYCARCGEQQPGHHDLTVGHFLHDLMHELLHLDGKLFRTLKVLVTRPGQLTAEYFAGQKKRSIGPLRLFLTIFTLQFLAFSAYKPAAIYSVSTFRKFDSNGALTKIMDRLAAKRHIDHETFEHDIDIRWQKYVSGLQLVNVIGMALILKLFFIRRRRSLVEHLVFASHYLSLSYLFTLLSWPIYAAMGFAPGPLQKTMTTLHIAIGLVYLFFSLKRYYGETTGKAVIKTALVWFGVYCVSVTIMGGALVAALLAYR
jgi:hypothetical protein